MALSRILPDFGTENAGPGGGVSDLQLEEQKLASYEAGYQAGWDDSANSNRDAGNQVSADFAQNMRDISVTYHDAYRAILHDLKPLLVQIVDAVLPDMARHTLGPRIASLIEAEISTGQRSDVVLFAAPGDRPLIQPMIEGLDDVVSIELRDDETLANGQVRLGFGTDHEHELDTTALIEGIQTAVHGFFHAHADAASATDDDPPKDLMKESA